MNERAKAHSQAARGSAPPIGGVLQRKCACGQHTMAAGECDECRKKNSPLQRSKLANRSSGGVPPIVHDVLRSSGRPLDPATRGFMEPRFGHDFSRVRVHSDARAAESAQAVDALAYTVGRQVVFGPGRFTPETSAGRRLLAHELTHVVQQENSFTNRGAFVIDPDQRLEQEAEAATQQIDSGGALRGVSTASTNGLQRTIEVEKPKDPIPNPGGKGVSQTNAATVQDQLGQLCSGGSPQVDASTGAVSISEAFCSVPGFRIGHEVLPAGPAPATVSTTPTGCTCICDLVSSKNPWKITVNDASRPHTNFTDGDAATGVTPGGSGGAVTTISPNHPSVFGSVSVSGKRIDYDPWLILGHELCGHGWLADRGQAETAAVIATIGRQPFTIDRENALRAEHQIEARGRSFRDPFCGESYERSKTAKPGKEFFEPRLMDLCNRARAKCKKPDKSPFKIEEKIPDTATCA